MNKREIALFQGLAAAHHALLEAVESSIAIVPRQSTPGLSPTPAPEPRDAEDEVEIELAEVCSAAEIEGLRTLGETLTKATNAGATMPRYLARWVKSLGEGA